MGRKSKTGVKAASQTSIEITFTYQNQRCRERIALQPSAANLKRAQRHRFAILDAIAHGTFDYAATFPNSKRAAQFASEPGAAITIERFLTTWWRTEEKELKSSTRLVDRRTLFNQIIPAFGQMPVTCLKWPAIRDWAKSQGWSLKTQNNKLSILRRALNEAVERELIAVHPMANKVIRRRRIAAPGGIRDKIDPFDHNERAALIATASGQLRHLVQFGFWTGLRISELIALDWAAVDWINNQIYIDRALTQAAKVAESTKTDTGERFIDLLPPAVAALRAQKINTFLAGGEIFQNETTGERWSGDVTLRARKWTGLCRLAGVRYRPPKQMRHTFASMALMAGESPQWVAAQMGHRDWTFTARVYYRWIPRDAAGAGSKLTAQWGGQKPLKKSKP